MSEDRKPPDTGATDGEPHQTVTDLFVGMRLCMRRMMLKMEQQDLAMAAGITVKQLQEFEAGLVHISAPRLYQFSQYLGVPVSWFFHGLGSEAEAVFGGRYASAESVVGTVRAKEDFELLRYYFDNITDPRLKRSLVEVARVMAEPDRKLRSKKH